MADPRRAWLSLGSNLGDRAALVEAALVAVAALSGTEVLARSSLYRTPPWGDLDQGEFVNATAEIATTLGPHRLLDACQAIETRLGRVRDRRWGPRTIDIDILHAEGHVIHDARLTLPHPLWGERAFVLVPLAEIAPDLVIGGILVRDALRRCHAHDIVRLDVGSCP